MTATEIFSKSAVSLEIWERLLQIVRQLDGATIAAKKTCVHVDAFGAAFVGVHPTKNGLRLNLVLDRAIESLRIRKFEMVSKSRYHNDVNLSALSELDAEIVDWIFEAYELRRSKSN